MEIRQDAINDPTINSNSSNAVLPVVIVGAGPTGLTMAVQLIRYGIPVIILEKNKQATTLSKAVVVQARTLELFREVGLSAPAILEGRVTTALNVFQNGKKKAGLVIANLGLGLTEFPFALSLEQSKTEKLLVDHLIDKGVQVQWGCTFSRMEQQPDRVVTWYTDANGHEQRTEGAYLVGCDGAASPVRHQLGFSFDGDTVPKLFYVCDVVLQSEVINKDELFIFLIEKGFVLFFPMEGTGHYRVIGILPEDTAMDPPPLFQHIEASIAGNIRVPIIFVEVKWFSTYKVHSRKSDHFGKGRCFIAGDAAHIHTPAGGQGMNTGIQDAYNLAWKMAFTIRNQASPAVLESYGEERMKNAKHLLQTTDRMFDLMAGTGWFWNFIRLHFFPTLAGLLTRSRLIGRKAFVLLSQIGISYRSSPLTERSSVGRVHAGDRMPYFLFSNGKQVADYRSGTSFTILFFGVETKKSSIDTSGLSLPAEYLSFTEIPKTVFGRASGFYILLRPDAYIAYIGNDPVQVRNTLAACCRSVA